MKNNTYIKRKQENLFEIETLFPPKKYGWERG